MTDAAHKEYDVLVIGNATTDHVLVIPDELVPGRKAVATSMLVAVGGESLNTAVTLSALGLRVNYVGCFGGDAAGMQQQGFLHQAGCSTEGSLVVESATHHFATIVVDARKGDRTIVTHKDPALAPTVAQMPPDLMSRSRALFSDGREQRFTLDMLKQARRSGTYTFLDAEESAWLPDALPFVDEFIGPKHVVCEITGCSDTSEGLSRVLDMGPAVAVATMGADGSIACTQIEGDHEQSAVATKTVDTTGAGDAFHGGYVAARLSGSDIPGALTLGAMIAAIACEHLGPRPPRERIVKLLEGDFASSLLRRPE